MPKRKSDDDQSDISASKRRKQVFLSQYTKDFRWIEASKRNEHSARCKFCTCELDLSHGGRNDILRHEKTEKHVEYERLMKSTARLNFVNKPANVQDRLDAQVIRAESTIALLICELNLPLATADKFTHVFKEIFPDSRIAEKYKASRNKTNAILNNLAQDTKNKLINAMKLGPFTLSTDGSNDERSKQFPLVIRTSDGEMVSSELLCVPTVQGSATGENIFSVIDAVFSSHGIPWENCISFGSDNANVMVG